MQQSRLAFLSLLVPALLLAASAASATSTGTYWHTLNQTLWVYDKTPELGIGSHEFGGPDVPVYRDLQVQLVRFTLYWSLGDDGTNYQEAYLQAFASKVYAATHDSGVRNEIEPVIVVHSAPGVFNFQNRYNAYSRFAQFMGTVATRCPDVRFWELWNEQDAGATNLFGYGDGMNTRSQGYYYAEMLRQAYPAIKQANPRAWVLVGGLVGMSNWDFIRGIYDGNGSDSFDFMAIHTYGSVAQINSPTPDGFRTRAQNAIAAMSEGGRSTEASRPLWNTEFGASSVDYTLAWNLPHINGSNPNDGTAFDEHQRQWWQDALDIHQTSGLYTKVLGYQLRAGVTDAPCFGDPSCAHYIRVNSQPSLDPDDYGYGLFRKDGVTIRPTYTYLKTRNFNAGVVSQRTENVVVYAPGLRPVGYSYSASGGNVTIYSVPINRMAPTVIQFQTATAGCGEASCVPAQSSYISHFTGLGCTGTESYYLPYDGYAYQCRPWNGQGQCGTIRRTVTNRSYRDTTGTCRDAWTSGNTLSDFVTVYR